MKTIGPQNYKTKKNCSLNYLRHFIALAITFSLISCGGQKGNQPLLMQQPSKDINKEDTRIDPLLSYQADILPVIQQRCALCHNESSGLPNWQIYQVIFSKQERVYQRVVVEKSMPQGNLTNMTENERVLFKSWIEQGALP